MLGIHMVQQVVHASEYAGLGDILDTVDPKGIPSKEDAMDTLRDAFRHLGTDVGISDDDEVVVLPFADHPLLAISDPETL
jgi:hypothetical protein